MPTKKKFKIEIKHLLELLLSLKKKCYKDRFVTLIFAVELSH